MRDPKRIPIILDRIKKMWKKHPDLRLGQIIVDCLPVDKVDNSYGYLYYIEDDKLFERLKQFEEKKE